MANISRHLLTVSSDNTAVVNSASVRTGGEAMNVQFILAPGADLSLQISPDDVNWALAEDNSGVAIGPAMGLVARNVATLGEYARIQVANVAVNNYAAVLSVRKEIM
jgi:hypothetical protein